MCTGIELEGFFCCQFKVHLSQVDSSRFSSVCLSSRERSHISAGEKEYHLQQCLFGWICKFPRRCMLYIYKTALNDALWWVPPVPNPPGTKFHPHVKLCFIHLFSLMNVFHSNPSNGISPWPISLPTNKKNNKNKNNILQHHHEDEALLKQKPLFFSEWCSRYTPVSNFCMWRTWCESGEVGMGKLYWSSICKCESWLQCPKQNFLNEA